LNGEAKATTGALNQEINVVCAPIFDWEKIPEKGEKHMNIFITNY
jgi:hypothetical protein